MIVKYYKKTFLHRYDDPGYLKYYRPEEFPGLRDEPFRFKSGENSLAAHWYSYENAGSELIVFSHGIGGGHLSYMKEIALLCGRGYTVLAFDNTGCFDSEGADIRCMSQSLADLDAALRHVKTQGELNRFSHVYAVGHSWGGYAVGNIPALHPEIEKAAAISGFVSVERLALGAMGGAKDPVRRLMARKICAYEQKTAPEFYPACTLDAVRKAPGTKFLFAHSEDDPSVPFALNTGWLRQELDAPNAEYLICSGKLHNPNYTADASAYMAETFDRFHKEVRRGKLKTQDARIAFFADADWDRMTAQDETFWDNVCAFLSAD